MLYVRVLARAVSPTVQNCRAYLQRVSQWDGERYSEIRDLIRQMSSANLLWGAPGIAASFTLRLVRSSANSEQFSKDRGVYVLLRLRPVEVRS
jgi:hypothetical protein